MNLQQFSHLPDDARVWIHAFRDPLTPQQQDRIRRKLEGFVPQWVSHSRAVEAAFDIWHDRFVVTAAWCPDGVSGCSTDSFVRNFKELQSEGLDGLDGGIVYYRDAEGSVLSSDHIRFEDIVEGGDVQAATPVFDTLVSDLGTLRKRGFELPFSESWHARRYRLPEVRTGD